MSDAPLKPDDAPVTWGELREVVDLLGHLGVLRSTYVAQAANPAGVRDEVRFKDTEARVREITAVLSDRFIKAPE